MRRSLRDIFQATLLLGAGIIFAAGSLIAAGARPYIIITHDGHRFFAESKPSVRGIEAYVRLLPSRQLAVIKEELIDWKRTAEANVASEPIALPAGSTFVDKGQTPIIHTIVGKPSPVNPEPAATPEEALRARYTSTLEQRRQTLARRMQLQDELQALVAGGAAAAGGDDQRAARANELRQEIDALDGQAAKLDAAIEAIVKEAAVLGITLK